MRAKAMGFTESDNDLKAEAVRDHISGVPHTG